MFRIEATYVITQSLDEPWVLIRAKLNMNSYDMKYMGLEHYELASADKYNRACVQD